MTSWFESNSILSAEEWYHRWGLRWVSRVETSDNSGEGRVWIHIAIRYTSGVNLKLTLSRVDGLLWVVCVPLHSCVSRTLLSTSVFSFQGTLDRWCQYLSISWYGYDERTQVKYCWITVVDQRRQVGVDETPRVHTQDRGGGSADISTAVLIAKTY